MRTADRMRANPGRAFAHLLRDRARRYAAAKKKSQAGSAGQEAVKTGELYRVPYARSLVLAGACLRILRYDGGVFRCGAASGDFMCDLSHEEQAALRIVVLLTKVKEEQYGAAHQLNWKKTGLPVGVHETFHTSK